MKLRFNDNTLRLRLSQSDVARLAETGGVEETVTFGQDQVLRYKLESSQLAGPDASFEGGLIRVRLPEEQVKHWIESDETGIEESSGPLKVLVEKDFQCLHRATELEADAFPNPLLDKF